MQARINKNECLQSKSSSINPFKSEKKSNISFEINTLNFQDIG